MPEDSPLTRALTQYTGEPEAPIGAFGGSPRNRIDSPALRDFLKRLSVSAYLGAPLHQAFLDVQGTGNNARNQYGNLDTKRTPLFGGRLQYEVNPHLALALEAMKGSMDITGQQGRHQNLRNVPYPVDFMGISPSIQGRLPTDYGTPYAGIGPYFNSTTQRTSDRGSSPPSFDIGLNAYAGYESPDFLKRLRAFIEAGYLYNNSTGGDVEGQFAGPMQHMSLRGGLKYRFGQ